MGGVPLFLSFLPESMILVSFFKFSIFSFFIFFINFVIFFFVLCKFCWRSLMSSYFGLNFLNIGYYFYCLSFFGFFFNKSNIKKVSIKVFSFNFINNYKVFCFLL